MKRVTPPSGQQALSIKELPEGVLITVHIQPHAGRTEYAGIHGDALKFRVAAPPVDGAANDALCQFLADRFNLPKKSVELEAGAKARRKRILLKGVSARRVLKILDPMA